MKVLAVLEALPGTGKVKARRLMEQSASARPADSRASAPSSASRCSRPSSPALILVVFGPGGVGKGTVIRRLVARDGHLWLSGPGRPVPARPGEPEDAYTFVDRDTFQERVGAGGFLEWATVLGEYYGTPTPDASGG